MTSFPALPAARPPFPPIPLRPRFNRVPRCEVLGTNALAGKGKSQNLLVIFWMVRGNASGIRSREMVEAGGVEPPSEKARLEENYARIRLKSFEWRLRTGENNANLVRLGLGLPALDRSYGPILQNDAH